MDYDMTKFYANEIIFDLKTKKFWPYENMCFYSTTHVHLKCWLILWPLFTGNNMMFVGMMGPKGPCEELCVKNQGGYVYKINYIVRERGDYMLVVKWGDQQIPGSPFCVHVD